VPAQSYNFNLDVYNRLELFEKILKEQLLLEKFLNVDEMGILPNFDGILCHDHWKPYYNYDCTHCLCNAHHLRESQRAWKIDKYNWAKAIMNLLLEASQAVVEAGGQLAPKDSKKYRHRYDKILAEGEVECPPPDASQRKKGQRGRLKCSKSRNLLERLRDFKDDSLRFMDNSVVEFTITRVNEIFV
jgi:transposase